MKKHSKGNSQQSEETTYRMGKIIFKHTCNGGLISKIHKECKQLVARKQCNLKTGK